MEQRPGLLKIYYLRKKRKKEGRQGGEDFNSVCFTFLHIFHNSLQIVGIEIFLCLPIVQQNSRALWSSSLIISLVYLKHVIIIYYCNTTLPPTYSLDSEDWFKVESMMVWGIIGNSQKKNQKNKQDQGQRNIKSIPVSMMAQWVRNPPAMQETRETWVWSLGQEDPLDKKRATHSSILAWEIPWSLVGYSLVGLQRVWDMTDWVHTHR